MRILVIGDVYGRAGRDAVKEHVPLLRAEYKLDVVIANVDNASHGNGITTATVKEIAGYGVDIMTGGDHVWDQKDFLPHMDRSPFVLRAINYPEGTPGKGFHVVELPDRRKLLVAHALGRVFIDSLTDNPFHRLDTLVSKYQLGRDVQATIVDFHAEATSEKNAMGHFLDGRVSAVLGTHTHVPTGDARLLAGGTAYLTDLGMTGDYDGVIGADKAVPLEMFRTGLRFSRFVPADGVGTLCGAFIETDDATGKALRIEPVKRGGLLET